MNDSHTTRHVPIWGLLYGGGVQVLGTVSVDRSGARPTYMAQDGDESATFGDEISAAAWLHEHTMAPVQYVLVGRIFRPEAVARQSAAEQVHRAQRTIEDVYLPDSAREPVSAAH